MKHQDTHNIPYASAVLIVLALLVLGSGCSTSIGLGFGFGSGGSSLSLGVSTALPREKADVWAIEGSALLSEEVQQVTLTFPKRRKAEGKVWGTDVYDERSNIGMAAVHSGLITFEEGGTVTVRRQGKSNQFFGSKRYGITTLSSQKTAHAFLFVKEGS